MPAALFTALLAGLKALLASGWVWLLPALGPLLYRLRPLLGWLPGGATVWTVLKAATYVAVLGFGVWWGAKLFSWWQGDVLTAREARIECDDTLARASVKAREAALKKREAALDVRAAELAVEEIDLDELEERLEAHRVHLPNDADPVFTLDDPWLRAKQR